MVDKIERFSVVVKDRPDGGSIAMEDFGTAPYWLQSRTAIAAGLTKSDTTMSSATFDIHGVSDIGLRSFFKLSTIFLG